MAHDSKTTFCTLEGCGRPRRARGLCSTHYNQQHQPDRHRKVTMDCGWCGADVLKYAGVQNKYAAAYCSLEHREHARSGAGMRVDLPSDHWGLWFGKSSQLFVRHCIGCDEIFATSLLSKLRCKRHCELESRPARFTCGACADCGQTYTAETNGSPIRYCSTRCVRRTAKRKRRAREHNAPGSFTYGQLITQYIRQGQACAYCKQPTNGTPDPEHVLPLSRGGRNDMSNLVAACRACNTDKGDLTLTEWAASRAKRGLPAVDSTLDAPAYRHVMHNEPTRPPYRLAA